jgi:prophage regulatory protein
VQISDCEGKLPIARFYALIGTHEKGEAAMSELDRIIRAKELEGMLGVSKATVSRWSALGHLPKPIRIGPRAVGWQKSVIEAFIARRAGNADVVEA